MRCKTQPKGGVKLRDTPATEYELGRMQMYRERGTSPGNPRWYSCPVPKPFEFKAGQPAVVPAWTRSKSMEPQKLAIPADVDDNPAEYIRRFDKLNRLKDNPVLWIKVPDGNYA